MVAVGKRLGENGVIEKDAKKKKRFLVSIRETGGKILGLEKVEESTLGANRP